MTTKEAIDAIVTYETLPSQIDYTLPYRFKARRGEDHLNSLSEAERYKAQKEINKRVSAYFDSPAYELDELF